MKLLLHLVIQAPKAHKVMQHAVTDAISATLCNRVPPVVLAWAPVDLSPADDAARLLSKWTAEALKHRGKTFHLA